MLMLSNENPSGEYIIHIFYTHILCKYTSKYIYIIYMRISGVVQQARAAKRNKQASTPRTSATGHGLSRERRPAGFRGHTGRRVVYGRETKHYDVIVSGRREQKYSCFLRCVFCVPSYRSQVSQISIFTCVYTWYQRAAFVT